MALTIEDVDRQIEEAFVAFQANVEEAIIAGVREYAARPASTAPLPLSPVTVVSSDPTSGTFVTFDTDESLTQVPVQTILGAATGQRGLVLHSADGGGYLLPFSGAGPGGGGGGGGGGTPTGALLGSASNPTTNLTTIASDASVGYGVLQLQTTFTQNGLPTGLEGVALNVATNQTVEAGALQHTVVGDVGTPQAGYVSPWFDGTHAYPAIMQGPMGHITTQGVTTFNASAVDMPVIFQSFEVFKNAPGVPVSFATSAMFNLSPQIIADGAACTFAPTLASFLPTPDVAPDWLLAPYGQVMQGGFCDDPWYGTVNGGSLHNNAASGNALLSSVGFWSLPVFYGDVTMATRVDFLANEIQAWTDTATSPGAVHTPALDRHVGFMAQRSTFATTNLSAVFNNSVEFLDVDRTFTAPPFKDAGFVGFIGAGGAAISMNHVYTLDFPSATSGAFLQVNSTWAYRQDMAAVGHGAFAQATQTLTNATRSEAFLATSSEQDTRTVSVTATNANPFLVATSGTPFTSADHGRPVTGTGIPAGTYLRYISSSTTIAMANGVTGSSTSVGYTGATGTITVTIGSGALLSQTAGHFTPGDVGASVIGAGFPAGTLIVGYVSPAAVNISAPTNITTASGLTAFIAANVNFTNAWTFLDQTTIVASRVPLNAGTLTSFASTPTFSEANGGSFTASSVVGFTSSAAVGGNAAIFSRVGYRVSDASGTGSVAAQFGILIDPLTFAGVNIGFANNSTTVFGLQSQTAVAGGTVAPTATAIGLSSASDVTLGNPNIGTGAAPGHHVLIVNVGSHNITFTAGSAVFFPSPTLTLTPGSSASFIYTPGLAGWVCTASSTSITTGANLLRIDGTFNTTTSGFGSYGTASFVVPNSLTLRFAQGTSGTPTRVLNGNGLGGLLVQGWNDIDGAYNNAAFLGVSATGDFHTAGNAPANLSVQLNGGSGLTTVATFSTAGVTALSMLASSATGGVGYTTGAGGTVAQATSKSTGVILNKVCGRITMNNAALAASTSVGFTLTDSAIAATDGVKVWIVSAATANAYFVVVDAVAAGSCHIHVRNTSAGSLSEAIVIGFAVIKAVTA